MNRPKYTGSHQIVIHINYVQEIENWITIGASSQQRPNEYKHIKYTEYGQ